MKIEKLTDNKIRVIVNTDELGFTNFNAHNIMEKAFQKQEIFSDILKKAEKEVSFYTDGYKLLIEAFSSFDDIIVFTITKFLPDKNLKKKKLIAKRKTFDQMSHEIICCFNTFDAFCEFCNAIKLVHRIDPNKLAKNIVLYLWKGSYYLVLKNLNNKDGNIDLLYSILSEFGRLLSPSNHFDCKLLEYGKVIIKNNAIRVGIQYF